MAALTQPDKAYILQAGPFAVEVILCEATVNDGDTVNTKLANATSACVLAAGDASGTNDASAALSGKVVTIHDPPNTDLVVLVFGNSMKQAT